MSDYLMPEENVICLTRGDTGKFKFQRKNAEGHVILTAPDAIYFTVKRSFESSSVMFQKTLEDMTLDQDGMYHFTIAPADTAALDYGNYVYDVEVTELDYVQTISKGKLNLLEEATWYTNK